MPVDRVFLGWDRPLLPSVADWLMARAPDGDWADWVVVVPGRRAGRRLLEILIDRCGGDDACLVPPRIVTASTLADFLDEPQGNPAPPLVQRMAWVHALQRMRPETRERFLPQPPSADNLASWIVLARLLEDLHVELAGQGLGFDAVANRVPSAAKGELARWRALAELQKAYLARLREQGCVDRHAERRHATERVGPPVDRLVIAGLVELPAITRRLIEQRVQACTVLLAAPETCRDHFDALGQLIVERWVHVAAPIADEQIRLVGGPREQATATADALRGLDGRLSADQIAIGVLDPELAPFLEEELPGLGVRVRAAQAARLERSSPGLLLQSLEQYLRQPTFSRLAALARHPDMEALLDGGGRGDPITALDKLFGQRLPRSLDDLEFDSTEPVGRVRDACDRLLLSLRGARPLAAWAEPLAHVLGAVFGQRPRQRHAPDDQSIVEACEHLRSALEALRSVDARTGEITAADAIVWLLSEAGAQRLSPFPDDAAIDLVGWLDLVVDDAEAVILVGCNDEHVPERVPGSLFLSEGLRRRLSLPDNEHRLARDAYHLTAMASRHGRTLRIIAGRVTAEGQPLRPSRLLLLDDAETVARRLMGLSRADDMPPASDRDQASRPPRRRVLAPGQMRLFDGDEGVSRPLGPWLPSTKGLAALTELSVTAFRDYLGSPYRFYLKHMLKLAALDDEGAELDAAAYGSLVHEALQALQSLSHDQLCVREAVEEALDAELLHIARRRFGRQGPPALAVQIEQARQRLRAFARCQAEWARQGWRIHETEHEFDRRRSLLDVDGEPLTLSAKADRIDFHPERKQWAILDYKTGDKAKTPQEKHLDREGWIDLQLPLYRYLAQRSGLEGSIVVGYALLPRSLSATRMALAEWNEELCESGVERARDVVRAIRRGEFPLSPRATDWTDEYSVLCHETFPESIELDDEHEWESE